MKKSELKEHIKAIITENPDMVSALYLSNRGPEHNRIINTHWMTGGIPFVFSKRSKKCYVGALESTHAQIYAHYSNRINRGKMGERDVDLDDIPTTRADKNSLWGGRMWPNKLVITFWNYPNRHDMVKVIEKIQDECIRLFGNRYDIRKFGIEVLMDMKRKDADPYLASDREKIDKIQTVIVPMVKYLSGDEINIPKHGRMKKDKLLRLGYAAAAKNQDVAHILSPVLKKRKSFDKATKDALMAYYKKQDKYTPEDKNFLALLRTLG